jgi:hypothetical protein
VRAAHLPDASRDMRDGGNPHKSTESFNQLAHIVFQCFVGSNLLDAYVEETIKR